MKVFINILFFLGIFLLFIGIITTQVIGGSSIVSIATTVVGIGLIIGGLISFLYTNKGFWGKRSTEATINALISTVAVILIIFVINFLGIKYAVKIDLTENKLFTLSSQSQELVKNLASPLKVYVFDAPINEVDRELLEDYNSYNDFFDYQFVDPQVDINLAQKFNVTRLGDVYLEHQGKQQLVQIVSPNNRLSEIKLTTAIAKIQRNIDANIYILQGHGEPLLQEGGEVSFAQAVKSLRNQGYVVEGLDLNTSPLVPPTVNILLVSSGDRKLSPTEVEKIKQYLDRGGNLLVMYNAQTINSLEAILNNQWGIAVDDSLAIDASGKGNVFGFGPSISIVVNYGVHPITKDFNQKMTIFPWARPIIITPAENIEATPLLITTDQSWGETNLEQENINFNPTEDIQPPLNLGVALVKRNMVTKKETKENQGDVINNPVTLTPEEKQDNSTVSDNNLPTPPTIKNPNQSPSIITSDNNSISAQKMVVLGNSNFATDGWFQQQLNSDFLLNAIAWLADEKEESLSIRPKESTNRRLNISKSQVTLISWLALLIIPGLSLIVTIVTWWQRSR